MDATEHAALTRAGELYRRGELDPAQEICESVLKRNRRSADALQLLGLIAFQRSRPDQAAAFYRRAIALSPREPRFHYLLGKVMTVEDRFDDALASFDAALRLDPRSVPAIAWKAIALERRGDREQARALIEPFIRQGTEDPDMAEVWAKLELRAQRPQEVQEVLRRHLARHDLRPISRQGLGFLLGQAHEQAREYDQAFEAYRHANEAMAVHFDAAEYVERCDRLIAVFSAQALSALPRATNRSQLPLFVVGMPRSGTTLIEQIIDAHPQAAGAGEITYLEDIAETLPGQIGSPRPYPECAADMTARAVEHLGRVYLNQVERLVRGAKRLVNKSLETYKHLGLAALLLPGARVIHCRRDPLDTCFSCFASHLMPPRHAYASDLRSLGLAFRQYQRLMRHWHEVLDLPILDVSYEELVAEPRRVTPAILEFCGLEWDERCLRFHESGRFASTLSYDQVRRPLYDTSIGRASHYQRHLGPLREALSGDDSPGIA